MKTKRVFLALIGILVLMGSASAQAGQKDRQGTKGLSSFVLAKSFPQVPELMTIYEAGTPSVSKAGVEKLMAAFAMKGEVGGRKRQWIVRDGPKTLEVFKEAGTGYIRFSNDEKLGAEREARNLPSAEDALAKARRFFKGQGMLSDDMVVTGVGSFDFEIYDSNGLTVKSGKSAVQVGFGFVMDGRKVEGPGAKAGVVFGEDGEIIGMSWIFRTVKPAAKVKILTPGEAFSKFKRRWPPEGDPKTFPQALVRTEVIIKDVRLTYFAEPGLIPQISLRPIYMFEGDFTVIRKTEKGEIREADHFSFPIPAESDKQN
jgi:hypothetical protein